MRGATSMFSDASTVPLVMQRIASVSITRRTLAIHGASCS